MKLNFENSMYPRSFLCEEAKIKQRTSLKKQHCEIGEEAIWESQYTSIFFVATDATRLVITQPIFGISQ